MSFVFHSALTLLSPDNGHLENGEHFAHCWYSPLLWYSFQSAAISSSSMSFWKVIISECLWKTIMCAGHMAITSNAFTYRAFFFLCLSVWYCANYVLVIAGRRSKMITSIHLAAVACDQLIWSVFCSVLLDGTKVRKLQTSWYMYLSVSCLALLEMGLVHVRFSY